MKIEPRKPNASAGKRIAGHWRKKRVAERTAGQV